MNLNELTSVDRLWVFKKTKLAGELSRTKEGSQFRYLKDYLESESSEALAFGMPLRQEPFDTLGLNLSPFFAGLLPEGLRLNALQKNIKTSPDDMFSILAACGADLIGDVCVSFENKIPEGAKNFHGFLEEVSFEELFIESLETKNVCESSRNNYIQGIQPKLSPGLISFPVSLAKSKKAYILKLESKEFPGPN